MSNTAYWKENYNAVVAERDKLATELEQYRQAEQDGRLQIIDKALFCRNASKRDGRCAGYHENMFSHATLRMCAGCDKYDPSADEADYYEDAGEDHEDNG